MGSYVIDVTVKELTVPNSPLIAKAYDAGLIKVTDIQDGVVGDLSTFRVDASKAGEYQNLLGKLGQQSAICWNSLGLFRDYGLNYNFFRNKTFLFLKIENWNFQHLFENEFCDTSQNITSFRQFDILWGFLKLFFKQMLKISVLYLEKQKKI